MLGFETVINSKIITFKKYEINVFLSFDLACYKYM